jgi:hypothetical protein
LHPSCSKWRILGYNMYMQTVLKQLIRLSVLLAAFIMLAGATYSQDDYQAYVIKAGEDLAVIAEKFHTTVQKLAAFNKNLNTDELHPGDMMRVPIIPQTMVVVPKSDDVMLGGAAGNVQMNNYLQPQPKPQPQPQPQPQVQIQPQEENGIIGVIGKVSVDVAEIRSEPGAGRVLFSRTIRGTELLVTDTIDNYYGVAMADGSTGWIQQLSIELTNERRIIPRSAIIQSPEPSVDNIIEQPGQADIVNESMKYLGIPYRLGGKLPNNVDCSLLVQTVFSKYGIKLPRTAAEQSKVGETVEFADLQPGDRLYFYKSSTSNIIGHTGIYIGNGQFIHASSNRGKVGIDKISEKSPYWNKLAWARR